MKTEDMRRHNELSYAIENHRAAGKPVPQSWLDELRANLDYAESLSLDDRSELYRLVAQDRRAMLDPGRLEPVRPQRLTDEREKLYAERTAGLKAYFDRLYPEEAIREYRQRQKLPDFGGE